MQDFSILCLLFILIHFISVSCKVKSKIELWIYIIILMIMSAFRGPEVGNDTHEYIRIFEASQQQFFMETSRYEHGFIWINKYLRSYTDNPQILFIVYSVFLYFSIGRFISKYSRNKWLSVFMLLAYGFFSFTFTAVRQGIALGILLFSFDYIISGKKFKFLILILLASLFHTTSLLFVFAYLAKYIKPSVRVFAISGLVGLGSVFIFSVLLNFIFRFFTMYQHYAESSYIGEAGLANIFFILISSSILIFSYRVLYKRNGKSITSSANIKIDNTAMILVMFAVVFYILSMKANILDRIGLYYNIYSIILLPNAIKALNINSRTLIQPLTIIFFYLYTITILLLRPGWNSVFPYSFC